MTTYQTVQGSNYRLLVTSPFPIPPDVFGGYLINPFDLNGNLIPEITIEVDSTIAPANIYLPTFVGSADVDTPYISTNGETNFTIKIVKISDDLNFVNVICAPFMRFSGYVASVEGITTLTLTSQKDSLEITPIGLATLNTYQPFLCVDATV
jgi:hypothetical protein